MKTKLLFSLTLFLLVTSGEILSQNVPSYVPTTGLQGWWPFNGNADDKSGSGNNGIVNGATLTTDRFGNFNNAYSFNGTTDYITLQSVPIVGNGNWTISFWFRSNEPTVQHILALGDENNISDCIQIFIDSNLRLHFDLNLVSGPISTDTVTNGDWIFGTVVMKSGTGFLFTNGILVDSVMGMNSNISNAVSKFIGKGRQAIGSAASFNGEIDDIGVWNRDLTQQEITNLYNSLTQPPCNSLPSNLTTGLIGYWPFCGNTNDESGNGHNCSTYNGPSLTSDRFGIQNAAYFFDGIDDWIQTNDTFFQADQPHSLSIWWMTTDSSKTNQTLFNTGPHTLENLAFHYSSSDPNPPYAISYGMGNGQVGVGSWNVLHPDNSQVPINGNLNYWHHCVWVKDSTYKWDIYIDGVLSSTFVSSLNVGSQIANLRFGAENNGVPTGGANFIGYIDDIGLWDRALSSQEVNQLYNQNLCYQTITVTDTLLINVHLTGLNPVTYQNTLKIYPNPTSDQITIDFGTNYSSLNGYSIRIDNTLGQTVFSSPVQQQSAIIDLNTWTGPGLYLVYLIDNQGHTIDVRKIILQ